MHDHYAKAIESLQRCSAECNHCFSACLKEDNVKMMARCIALNRQCADICDLAAAWLSQASELRHELLSFCATVCYTCAEECGHHENDHCQNCAKACRECADTCRNTV